MNSYYHILKPTKWFMCGIFWTIKSIVLCAVMPLIIVATVTTVACDYVTDIMMLFNEQWIKFDRCIEEVGEPDKMG